MKHEPATIARSDIARRVTERAARMREAGPAVIVPMAGEPEPGRSAIEQRRAIEEAHALERAAHAKALRAGGQQSNMFYPFPRQERVGDIHRSTIQRLIDKGKMRWVNSVHSAAVLVSENDSGEN